MLKHMGRRFQLLAITIAALLLAACGSMRSSVIVEPASDTDYGASAPVASAPAPARTPVPGGSYEVKKGDTLYSIAFRNGVDFRDLAQWNGVALPYTIWPGQRLKLSPAGKGRSTVPVTVASSPPQAVPTNSRPASSAAAPSAPMFEPVATPDASSGRPVASTPVSVKPKPTLPAVSATAPTVVPVAGVPTPPLATLPPPAPPTRPAAGGSSHAIGGVSWRWPADGSLLKRFQSGDAIPGIEIAGKAGDPIRAAADGVVVYSGNGLVGYGELVIIKHNDSFLSAYGHNSKRLVKEGQRVTAGQSIAEMGSTGASRNELEFQIRKDGNPVDPLGFLPSR
ncbi:peptidoglycan DD-metalloendopeptidase family protein [Rhodanobacter sp. L36]|uniref:peptidoglycan DD-metalloendopeptidase family protein n=1 Tax=Rhodanobacter sp. L36 TaxID=1747221 RepID=UPI00131E8BC1|nr:peptidoglycan DD-metalloendopeptidase family protein [Rhodanobacter sp. L36]